MSNRFDDVMRMQNIEKWLVGVLFIVQHLKCTKRGWSLGMKDIGKLDGGWIFSWGYRGATLIFEGV